MGILIPAAMALLALAVPIVLLYMLRLRRENLPVASSLLWRRALQDRTANAPWQRLKRNLLLLLQLLLLLLLVLSLARPFLSLGIRATGNLVAVLDASASMGAADEDGGATRFERAKREAAALVDGLAGDRKMTLVWAGPQAIIAAPPTSNKTELRAALDALKASNGRADMVAALTLASASARQLGDATVVLISDGALPNNLTLPQVPARALYVNVGKEGRNLGIAALSLRDTPAGPELFASVTNSGQEEAGALLSVKVDGVLRDSRRVQVGGRGEAAVTLQGLPLDTRLVEAELVANDKGADLLPADNKAWALRPSLPTSDVLLVSAGNGFLEKSLNLLPNTKLFKVAPAQYTPAGGSYGLTIFDAYMPAQLPPGNLLIFAPPDSPLIPVSGTVQYPAVGQVDVNDPLMRFVDLSNMHIASAARMVTPQWARALVRATTGEPLIMAGENGGRRVVAVAFDLHQSDLPLQVAFPILTANLVEWLRPSASMVGARQSVGVGDAVGIAPLPEADEVEVMSPDGREMALKPSGSGGVSFGGTDALGVYTVQQTSKGAALGGPERFVVNMGREEMDITPHPELAFTGTEVAPQQDVGRQPVEVWPWVLLASLGLLSVEWWVFNRAGRVRSAVQKGAK